MFCAGGAAFGQIAAGETTPRMPPSSGVLYVMSQPIRSSGIRPTRLSLNFRLEPEVQIASFLTALDRTNPLHHALLRWQTAVAEAEGGLSRPGPPAMTTRDFLFLMIIFPLAIIVGVVAFMGLQEMAMLDNMDELGAVFSHPARG